MDEAMGNFLLVNSEMQHIHRKTGELPPEILDLEASDGFFTAEMNVKLHRPIETPCVVIVHAALRGIDGRKIAFYVSVKGENNNLHATCDGLWIALRKGKL
jgi:acyl-CoA thioesterase FadM